MGYVCHGSELPFVFNVFTDGVSVEYQPTTDELQLSQDLSNAWANFITSGDPNTGLEIPMKYPLYAYGDDQILVLEEPGMEVQSYVRDSFCDMWDQLGYIY